MRFARELSLVRPYINANVSAEQTERLCGTCFRGRVQRLAGNFSHWNNPGQLLDDQLVREQLLANAHEAIARCRRQTSVLNHCVFSISHVDVVGWESTDEARKYDEADLEGFQPNGHSYGQRVAPRCADRLAPQTKQLTMVYDLVRAASGVRWTVDIQTIYPGQYIGRLHGNVTNRTGRVFFDFAHPGA